CRANRRTPGRALARSRSDRGSGQTATRPWRAPKPPVALPPCACSGCNTRHGAQTGRCRAQVRYSITEGERAAMKPEVATSGADRWDCLAAGEGNIDLILGGLAALPEPGTERLAAALELIASGSTAATAALLARLGARVGFVGRVGRDAWGE